MFLLAGLGNVGSKYTNTRHNVGFVAVNLLHDRCSFLWQAKPKFNAEVASGKIDCTEVILCKPSTYMNLSGEAISKVASFYKLEPKDIIVIHDDLDIPVGKAKYKIGGGTGGHNGLKSIDRHIGANYHRIRIGIGRPENPNYDISDFVLGKFTDQERYIVENKITNVLNYLRFIFSGKIEQFKKEIAQ